MSTTITGIFQSKVISNLDTYNHTALTAGPYMVKVDVSELPPSGLTIAIKQNSTTIATSVAPTAAQGVVSLQAVIFCSVNDVIGVVLSSSQASDSAINSIKGILNIHPGAV